MAESKEATQKHDRVLEIYSRLLSGETLPKRELADEYGVTPRSIQCDIDTIRDFYANRMVRHGEMTEIRYDRIVKGFYIISSKAITLTNAELFTIAKIILESRSLCKQEMETIIVDLINTCLLAAERQKTAVCDAKLERPKTDKRCPQFCSKWRQKFALDYQCCPNCREKIKGLQEVSPHSPPE